MLLLLTFVRIFMASAPIDICNSIDRLVRWWLGIRLGAYPMQTAMARAEQRRPTFLEVVRSAARAGGRLDDAPFDLEVLVARRRVMMPPGFKEILQRLLAVLEGS